jgi:FtsH-binding integral membrane protein
MGANKTGKTTLTEVIEEIRKSRGEMERFKDEIMKNFQASRILVWVSFFAFGFSIGIFALACLTQVGFSWRVLQVSWPAWVIWAMGVGMMVWVAYRMKRAEKKFREKWHEETPKL